MTIFMQTVYRRKTAHCETRDKRTEILNRVVMSYFCFKSKKATGSLLQEYHRKALLFVLKDFPYVLGGSEELIG